MKARVSAGCDRVIFPAGSFIGGFRTPALLPGPLLAPGRHPKPYPEPDLEVNRTLRSFEYRADLLSCPPAHPSLPAMEVIMRCGRRHVIS
jgi:hypothetical protein